jgi:transcriptional regulator with XRE-family HTH domain|nr:MAG TPA: bifunctional HTH-domain containing protein/aminotransferase [Caudoviricetes sp.]DAP26599.1 MAG TPA: bifunctional HTH-domain containing protein/aminotransferase [Bacteriophage sp.]DAQ80154.1 MAG TPA: bifunctional HTH-domain containing protein/aminotransferase [Caudoviricetes sp.]
MKNSSTSERLKQIMNERSLRQVDILEAAKPFCEKYGVKLAKNDLSQYVSGKVEPRQEKLTILGLALNVSETWLMGYDVRRERDEKEQPTVPSELSELDSQIMALVKGLSEEHKRLILAQLRGLTEGR